MQTNVCMLQVMEAATTRKAYAGEADGCMHAPSYGGSHHQKSLCGWSRWMYACSKLWRQPPPEKLMRVKQMDVCMLQVMEATTTRKAYAGEADGCMHAPSYGGNHHQKSLCGWSRWMYACSKLWRQPPPEKLMRVMQMDICMLQVVEATTTRKAYACDADGCMHAPSYGGSHHQKSLCVWCRWMYACSKL